MMSKGAGAADCSIGGGNYEYESGGNMLMMQNNSIQTDGSGEFTSLGGKFNNIYSGGSKVAVTTQHATSM